MLQLGGVAGMTVSAAGSPGELGPVYFALESAQGSSHVTGLVQTTAGGLLDAY